MVARPLEPREPGLHAWRPGAPPDPGTWQLVDWCDPNDGDLLVADSWRVVDGTARGFKRHRER
ncbi:MAG: hypothetical protein Q7J04_02115, partial [Microcella sp.]|nr:hypothetical protein [Microcella sp.]